MLSDHEELVHAIDEAAVYAVARRAERAERIALDVEANGMFAYRQRVCVVQLAFVEGERSVLVILDALRAPLAPLAAVLGAGGPPKVLHDLAFDARILMEEGLRLGHVEDTAVLGMLLDEPRTGLAALLEKELGVIIAKGHQSHDWARRPLEDEHLAYLVDDVRHLLALHEGLAARVEAAGITEEAAEEVAHRLARALVADADPRPPYARVKGATELDGPGRAALRSLFQAREEVARTVDTPAAKLLGSDALLALARARPSGRVAIRKLAGRGADHADAWHEAIAAAEGEADVPEPERAHFIVPPLDRAELARRRKVEQALTRFRRDEAKRRGVCEQAILPGHCLAEIAGLAALAAPVAPVTEAELQRVAGLGEKRRALYGAALVAIVTSAMEAS